MPTFAALTFLETQLNGKSRACLQETEMVEKTKSHKETEHVRHHAHYPSQRKAQYKCPCTTPQPEGGVAHTHTTLAWPEGGMPHMPEEVYVAQNAH